MPYITLMQSPRHKQISLEEILSGEIYIPTQDSIKTITATKTYFAEHIGEKLAQQVNILGIINALEEFNAKTESLRSVSRADLYRTFYIPKRSGGLRKIDAPNEDLMEALRTLKRLLEKDMFATYHTSAFAYIRGRCTVDAVKKHQQNASKWFLKTDFADFFGSTTEKFVFEMISQLFPFSEVVKLEIGKNSLKTALSLCFLNGGLPQGTPISPFITNLMMIPIDHKISNELRKKGFVYTRYADDIILSSRYAFNFTEQQEFIDSVLRSFNAPFAIKPEKTRYGSSAGQNWNLGVMLNKDNKITIGHKKKEQFRAMCCNYINDRKRNIAWDKHDVQVFAGLISYYKMIERDNIVGIISKVNKKFDANLMVLVRDDLKCR